MIKILLADDHVLFRASMRRIPEEHPEFLIVAEGSSGLEAVDLARRHQPDVAVVDIGMKELNGIEATSQILCHSPKTAGEVMSFNPRRPHGARRSRRGHCWRTVTTREVRASKG